MINFFFDTGSDYVLQQNRNPSRSFSSSVLDKPHTGLYPLKSFGNKVRGEGEGARWRINCRTNGSGLCNMTCTTIGLYVCVDVMLVHGWLIPSPPT